MKSVLIIGLLLVSILLISGMSGCPQKANQVSVETLKIAKMGGGAGILDIKCANLSFIEESSDYILKGIAKTKVVNWNEAKTSIITTQEFDISEYIKGPSIGEKILLQFGGGCIGEICEGVEDGGAYEENTELILHLREVNGELTKVC